MQRGARRALAALALVIAAGVLGGCGDRPHDVTTIRFWAMGREGEVVTALLPEFERAHPDVRVIVQQLPWTAAHEKLLTAFAGDATPDIAQLGNTWIAEFVALRALAPLDASIAKSGLDAGDFFPGIWQTNVVDGQVYGLPWYVDTRLLFYRRDILQAAGIGEPPRSWQEWTRALAAIEAHAAPDHYALLLPLNEVEPLVAFALSQGEPLLRDGGRYGNFESDGFRRALAFYVDMFRQGFAPPISGTQLSNVWNEFGRGTFAFYISGPWNIGEFERRLPASVQDTWATAPLPGPSGPGASLAGGSSLVVFRASKAKDAAWQLVEYLSRPDVELRFRELTGDLPPRRSAWRDPSLAADVHARAFRDQLERVRPTPGVPEWERIADEMRIVAERAVRGDLSIDEAARALDVRTDRILEKRRFLLERAARE
ncbi:MAG TPA: sugar ABC transporter substrate-binding protein [Casimicrobiaceae bacterium]|nr:sugar ABC transporter substrate-binding protein [Casimicrobiaceae bacterium]